MGISPNDSSPDVFFDPDMLNLDNIFITLEDQLVHRLSEKSGLCMKDRLSRIAFDLYHVIPCFIQCDRN